MKFLLTVLLIALLSAGAEYFMPWWSAAAVCFLVSLFVKQGAGRAFMIGFCGVGLLWLALALRADMANNHILSAKMAVLFHMPNYGLFVVVTVVIGGLVGGLAALCGALVKPKG